VTRTYDQYHTCVCVCAYDMVYVISYCLVDYIIPSVCLVCDMVSYCTLSQWLYLTLCLCVTQHTTVCIYCTQSVMLCTEVSFAAISLVGLIMW